MSFLEAALVTRILAQLEDLRQVAARVEQLTAKARSAKDPDYLDGAALNLHGFYAGVERILSEIARELDGTAPTGPEWHRDLLVQVSGEMPHVRPPVLTKETRNCLDEYRGFRHVVRNIYTFNLRPSRIYELADELPECFRRFERDLFTFVSFLQQLIPEE